MSQYLLGMRPEYDGLRVRPCLGKEIAEFTVTRRCRGATYRIHVKNGGGNESALKVGGQAIEGTVVPWAAAGQTVSIECEV